MKTASFNIPLPDRTGQVRSIRSIHKIAHFVERTLLTVFGGFSKGAGKGAWADFNGEMVEETFQVYEVAVQDGKLDTVGNCARQFVGHLGQPIAVTIAGEMYIFEEDDVRSGFVSVAAETAPLEWPQNFDVAIQTVVGPELHAAQDYFHVDPKKDLRNIQGSLFFQGRAVPQDGRGTISVVIYCQSDAGNQAAALAAERMISKWTPKAIFLMGIAAGRRQRVKIGDVVTPRVVVDDTHKVAQAGRLLGRPRIYTPPHAMLQQLRNYRFDAKKWHSRLLDATSPPRAPRGKLQLYRDSVARRPENHEAAIYSSNLLLRDSNVLEKHARDTHQQIKIGEMEAAGFGFACSHDRDKPVPWWVVRGVSDFGDEFKDDSFHRWAAHAAASYLLCLIEDGINFDTLSHSE